MVFCAYSDRNFPSTITFTFKKCEFVSRSVKCSESNASDGIVKVAPIDCSCTSSRYSSEANIQIFNVVFFDTRVDDFLPNRLDSN
jgi:hypothetical protein